MVAVCPSGITQATVECVRENEITEEIWMIILGASK